jgi:hypothetical protein
MVSVGHSTAQHEHSIAHASTGRGMQLVCSGTGLRGPVRDERKDWYLVNEGSTTHP